MIWESCYWKKPLLQMAARMEKFKKIDSLTERQLVQIERDVFIGFYSIRKLIETVTKLTDETKSMQVEVIWFPSCKEVNRINYHRIGELYDFSQPQKENRNLSFVCNKIIHSFIFSPSSGDEGLDGLFFSSDIDKSKKLYFIDIDDVIMIFKRVGKDYPTHITYQKQNPETEKEQINVK